MPRSRLPRVQKNGIVVFAIYNPRVLVLLDKAIGGMTGGRFRSQVGDQTGGESDRDDANRPVEQPVSPSVLAQPQAKGRMRPGNDDLATDWGLVRGDQVRRADSP